MPRFTILLYEVINKYSLNKYSINECVFLKRRLALVALQSLIFLLNDTAHPSACLNVLCSPTKRESERSCLNLIGDQGEKNRSQFKRKDYVVFFICCWPSYWNQKMQLETHSQKPRERKITFPVNTMLYFLTEIQTLFRFPYFFYLMFFVLGSHSECHYI